MSVQLPTLRQRWGIVCPMTQGLMTGWSRVSALGPRGLRRSFTLKGMARNRRTTSKAAKTAKSTVRAATSKTGRWVKKSTAARKQPVAMEKRALTGKKISSAQRKTTRPQQTRKPTPVQEAVVEGVTTHTENGVTLASDADALRVARAIAEHRKGLMDRLAK